MSDSGSPVPGYTVTVDVLVPAEEAERMAATLDERWKVESWSPEAAAFEVVRTALAAAGLHHAVNRGTRQEAS